MTTDQAPRLTGPQRRALEALADLCAVDPGRGAATPRSVAQTLWPDSRGWEQRSRRGSTPAGGALGATMPMKAATLLWRLHRVGLAAPSARLDDNRWTVTTAGWRLLGREPVYPRTWD